MEVQSISNTNKHTLVHINTKKRAGITLQFALEKGTIRPLWKAWAGVSHSNKEVNKSIKSNWMSDRMIFFLVRTRFFFSLERDFFSLERDNISFERDSFLVRTR